MLSSLCDEGIVKARKSRIISWVESLIPQASLEAGISVVVVQVDGSSFGNVHTVISIVFPKLQHEEELIEGLEESGNGGTYRTRILKPIPDVTRSDVLSSLPPQFPGGQRTREKLHRQARDAVIQYISQTIGEKELEERKNMAESLILDLNVYIQRDCTAPEIGKPFPILDEEEVEPSSKEEQQMMIPHESENQARTEKDGEGLDDNTTLFDLETVDKFDGRDEKVDKADNDSRRCESESQEARQLDVMNPERRAYQHMIPNVRTDADHSSSDQARTSTLGIVGSSRGKEERSVSEPKLYLKATGYEEEEEVARDACEEWAESYPTITEPHRGGDSDAETTTTRTSKTTVTQSSSLSAAGHVRTTSREVVKVSRKRPKKRPPVKKISSRTKEIPNNVESFSSSSRRRRGVNSETTIQRRNRESVNDEESSNAFFFGRTTTKRRGRSTNQIPGRCDGAVALLEGTMSSEDSWDEEEESSASSQSSEEGSSEIGANFFVDSFFDMRSSIVGALGFG